MRRRVGTKVLFEKRRAILLWAAVIFVTNISLALLFPAMRDALGTMMGSVPPGMEKWFGEASTWQTYTGYAGQELFGQMSTILIIMAILFGANYLAGYEGNGTLLTLLAKPLSRRRVYWEKYAAFAVSLAGVSLAFYAGAVVGGWVLGEPVEYLVFAQCMLMVFLLCLALGSVAYAIGAVTGKSGLAGIVTGFYAFVAYLLASLSTTADIVDALSRVSLFRYAAAPDVIKDGLQAGHVGLLVAVTAIAVIGAAEVFVRRDLRTR